eukprot:FR741868.1.p1 GENE.FR741868.1~~FR741868.1.p1  ORF type:complete len:269 (-),score=71.83 FR741868.1:319-1125(-)
METPLSPPHPQSAPERQGGSMEGGESGKDPPKNRKPPLFPRGGWAVLIKCQWGTTGFSRLGKGGRRGPTQINVELAHSLGPPRLYPLWFPAWYVGGEWEADNNFTQETAMTKIRPSAQLTLSKGNKSWSSTAVAAALELVIPLGSGPWLSLTAAAFFFFFFFFLFLFLWPARRINTKSVTTRPRNSPPFDLLIALSNGALPALHGCTPAALESQFVFSPALDAASCVAVGGGGGITDDSASLIKWRYMNSAPLQVGCMHHSRKATLNA